jgi:hypothetical protein
VSHRRLTLLTLKTAAKSSGSRNLVRAFLLRFDFWELLCIRFLFVSMGA